MAKIDTLGHRRYPKDVRYERPPHPELEQLVQNKVQSGRYNSASEVVREALRLMEQKDELRSIQLQEFRSRIDRSLAEAGRDESVDGDTFMQGLIADLDSGEAARKAG